MSRAAWTLLAASLLVACPKTGEGDTVPATGEPVGDEPSAGRREDVPGEAMPATTGSTAPPVGPRVVMVAADHPYHDRLEGTGFANDCATDADCRVGGCGSEVCSAEEGVVSTCELLPITWPEGRQCGCVDKSCVWWHERETLPSPRQPKQPATGVDERPDRGDAAGVVCGKRRCKPAEQCIEYYGIAGPQGPKFQECGIRCREGRPNDGCPEGSRCIVIADGPGAVCRKR